MNEFKKSLQVDNQDFKDFDREALRAVITGLNSVPARTDAESFRKTEMMMHLRQFILNYDRDVEVLKAVQLYRTEEALRRKNEEQWYK